MADSIAITTNVIDGNETTSDNTDGVTIVSNSVESSQSSSNTVTGAKGDPGTIVAVQATAPSSPTIGDLWVEAAI